MPDWFCEERCLRILEAAGVWVAALSTTAAVVVSLALARRLRPKLRMWVGLRTIVTPGVPGSQVEVIAFNVINHSERDAVLEGITWRRWRFGREWAYQTFQAPSPIVPHRLRTGERTMFFFPRQHEGDEWAGDVLREYFKPWPWLMVRLLKVYAYTPTGEYFAGKIESGLRKYLLEHAKNP